MKNIQSKKVGFLQDRVYFRLIESEIVLKYRYFICSFCDTLRYKKSATALVIAVADFGVWHIGTLEKFVYYTNNFFSQLCWFLQDNIV